MPRRLFVLRIPDGSIRLCFLHPRSSTLSSTTKPNHPHLFVGMLAFITQGLSSCRRLNHWGAWISPPVRLFTFFHLSFFISSQLSRSLNGAASALRLVSVFTANPDSYFSSPSLRASSLSSFVFRVITPPPPPTHPPPCMQKSLHLPPLPRCLHHHSSRHHPRTLAPT